MLTLETNGDSTGVERFEVHDLEFCSTCGTILPLPTFENNIMCRLCKKSYDISGKIFLRNL